PEGLSPQDVQAVIAAAACERDRLLLTTLWATGARVSEVLTLRPRDIHRQGLVLPNLKNPSRLVKTAHLSAAHAGLPGDLLVWARENGLADDEPAVLLTTARCRRSAQSHRSRAGVADRQIRIAASRGMCAGLACNWLRRGWRACTRAPTP